MLDATFGQEGKVRAPITFGGQALYQFEVRSAKFQSSGKIVVAGMADDQDFDSPAQSFLARLNQDGSLDSTFGAGAGYAIFRSSVHPMVRGIQAIEVLPDDKIIAVGYMVSPFAEDYATVLAGFDADGSPDSSFAPAPAEPALDRYSILRMANGKLLVVGSYKLVDDIYPPTNVYAFRFNASGAKDVDFQPVEIKGERGGLSGLGTVAVDAQGRFVVGMEHYGDFAAMARLGPTGSIDNSFGGEGDGYHFENWGRGPVEGVAIHPSGDVLLAGSVAQAVGTGAPQPTPALVRYSADGTQANGGFGASGLVLGAPGGGQATSWRCVMALRSGEIIVAGHAFEYSGIDGSDEYASNAARFLPDGAPDLQFGPGATGSIVLSEGMAIDACLMDELGRTVVVGHSRLNGTRALDAVRFWN